jgi:tight adherence protein B
VRLDPGLIWAGVRDRRAGRRRRQALERQLPVVVTVLAAHLRAGRSLRHALAEAATDVPDPSATALSETAAAMALGAPVGAALAALGERDDVRHLRAAVAMQARAGGDLALLLDRIGELLREREAQRRAAAVATAQARATGRMVTGMPLLGIAALALLDRPGFDLLVAGPVGWAALAASAGLAAAGHALIARIAAVGP